MPLLALPAVALLLVASWGIGAFALVRLARQTPHPPSRPGHFLLYALGAGLALTGHGVLVSGWLGAVGGSPLLLLVGLVAWADGPTRRALASALGALSHRRPRPARPTPLSPAFPASPVSPRHPWTPLDRALAGLLALGALLTFLGSMTPPFEYDVLEYHIGGPLRWLALGRVGFFPGNIYANMPGQTEMLYTLLLGLLGPLDPSAAQAAPGLLHWVFGAGALAVVAAVMDRFSVRHRAIRLGALILVVFHPVLFKIAFDPYIDLAVMFWVGLAALSWLDWRERPAARAPFALMVAFLSVAICAKLTAATLYLLPALAILVPAGLASAPAGRRMAVAARLAPWAGAVPLAVGAPWMVRAWWESGAPLFPAFSGLFPNPFWSPEQTARFLAFHGRTAPWSPAYLTNLLEKLHQPGFWAILPLGLVLASGRRDGRRPLAAWVLGSYAVWALARHSADRFILPALTVAAPLSALALDEAWRRRRLLVVVAWGLTALSAPGAVWRNVLTFAVLRPWAALAGADGAADWQGRFVSPPDSARAAQAAAVALPDAARLLLIYEARFALFPADRVAGSTLFDRSALIEALARDGGAIDSPDAVAQALRRQGFTHVLVNRNDLMLFIRLFTQNDYDLALETAERDGAEPPRPEDFHLPFLTDRRYGALRPHLLEFLDQTRQRAIHRETRQGVDIVWIAPL